MSFQDKTIQCSYCGTTFTFGVREQRFFASKGLTNEPRRCPRCRKNGKRQHRDSSVSWVSYVGRAMLNREYQQA